MMRVFGHYVELERGNNDAFFDAVLNVREGGAKWILGREGLCARTRMAWRVQLERASGRLVEVFGELVEVFGELGRSGKFSEGSEELDGMQGGEEARH